MTERNDKGHFVEQSSSLHPKSIGLRLHKSHYQKFLDLAEARDVTPAELARTIVEDWMEQQG